MHAHRTERPSRTRALRTARLWIVLVSYSALYLSWMIWHWSPPGLPGSRLTIGDLFQTLANVAAAVLCWRAVRRCVDVPPVRSAWTLIAAGATAAVVSNIFQLSYESAVGPMKHPSVSDAFVLCGYALVIAALLRFPTARAGGVQRLQLSLDAAAVAIGGAVIMWYVELGAAVTEHSSRSFGVDALSGLFTIGDLVALGAVAGVLTRGTMPSSARALKLFALGCVGFVCADVVYGYMTVKLHRATVSGDWPDMSWYVGFVLWSLAAVSQSRPDPAELERLRVTLPAARRPRWVPYLAVASSLGLMLYSGRHNAFYPVLSLMIASIVVVAVVAVRQLAAQRELIDAQRELQSAHDELAALATTDALTGLPNHRALVAAIDHELERCRRTGGRLALAFLDLDHFKALNDTLGHAAGDRALGETATTITSVLRAVDTVGRWGGEEFVVLLPDTGAEGALEAAERIRAAVARHQFASALRARLTCSIGVAVHPDDGTRRDALLQNADRAMYAAKQLGRNQVLAAGDQAAAAVLENTSSSREEQAMLGAVEALAAVVDARDNYTASHSADVAVLAQRVAMMLGCDANQTHLIGLAARLHDIGKVAVPDAVLGKPARLNDGEWRLIQRHPAIGADIAGRIPRLRSITPLIRAHHERWDGSGYPDGLAGEEIPLGARIICAADAYDAMVTDRPYEPRRSHAEALDELRRCAGAQFDPRVVDVLVRILSEERRAA